MPNGFIYPTILVTNDNDAQLNLSSNLTIRAFGFDAEESLIVGQYSISTDVTAEYINYDEQTRTGKITTSYSDIFYNHIWIIPSSIDLTGAPNNFTTTVSVWNSYFVQKTMTSVVPTNTTGIVFAPSTPKTFNALEFVNYSLSLSSNPPISVDGNYQFIFSNAEDPFLTISGVLSVTFPFLHDWSDGTLVERYSFLTNIIESHSGKEQRIKLRKYPRRQFESKILTADSSDYIRNGLIRMLFHNQTMFGMSKTWLVPLCTDYGILGYDLPSGSTTINTNTNFRDFLVNGYVLLYDKYDNYEIVRISSMDSSSLTLVAATTKNWNSGATIAPMKQCVVGQETVSGTLVVNEVEYNTVLWDVLVQDSLQNKVTEYVPEQFYKGYDVYSTATNFASENQLEIYNAQRRLDNNIGVFSLDSRFKLTKTRTDLNLLFKSKQELSEFLGFYYYRSGKLNPFFYEGHSSDIKIAQSGLDSDTTLRIADIGYSLYIKQADARRDLVFVKHDGTKLYRRITGSVRNSDGTETLSIDSPLGFNFSTQDFRYVSFLRFVRLDSDVLEISHLNTEHSTASLKLIDVYEVP